MSGYRLCLTGIRNRKGMTAVMVAVVLVILIGFAAMGVDVGYYMVTRNELQNIADATALYGTRWLGEQYKGMTPAEQQSYVCDSADVVAAVQEVASENYAGGMDGITIDAGDVRIGNWNSNTTPPLTQTLSQPDAVSVTARREGGTNGPISSIFAIALGVDTFDVNADATAALTGQGENEPGELELPVAISECFFLPAELAPDCMGLGCNDFVQFYPANDPASCAGWTTWLEKSNIPTLIDILEGETLSPEMSVGDDAYMFGGTGSTFDEMLLLFKRKGYDYDPDTGLPIEPFQTGHHPEGVPLLDEEGDQRLYPDDTPRNHHKWETLVMVYGFPEGEVPDCSNPNQERPISGYATILLTDVLGPPDHTVVGEILCDLISPDTRGGGGNYGTKGAIPGLVE